MDFFILRYVVFQMQNENLMRSSTSDPDDVDTLAIKAAIAQAKGDIARASAILARLDPAAGQSTALEIKTYQQILERRPSAMVVRLKQILLKPDPALGYINGELRFWLGWAQEVAGDSAAARESWLQARTELEPFHTQQAQNASVICDLALIHARLGDDAAAFETA